MGEGKMEKVVMILSGNSSLILLMRRVPRPEPVPPPSPCTRLVHFRSEILSEVLLRSDLFYAIKTQLKALKAHVFMALESWHQQHQDPTNQSKVSTDQ